jgi:cytochrome c551/c552
MAVALAGCAFGQAPTAVFTRYCVTCHSAALKTGGLVLDPDMTRVSANAEVWEKVVRKLRTNAMPPAGAPRPDQATYDSTAAFLESELDRAAAAKPQPGTLPLLHRLSRTEYQNAIRDLLALDALPKEMDYSLLLPPDNTSSGFDNIAELLFVSPTTMERYLDAARKISRLAVGDPNMPLMVDNYRLSPEQTQDIRVDELPFGTRGGLAVRSDIPSTAST